MFGFSREKTLKIARTFESCGFLTRIRRLALTSLEQGAGNRRHPAHVAIGWINFINADNSHALFAAITALQQNGGTKKNLIAIRLKGRVNFLRDVEPFGQKSQAPINFAQTPPVETMSAE